MNRDYSASLYHRETAASFLPVIVVVINCTVQGERRMPFQAYMASFNLSKTQCQIFQLVCTKVTKSISYRRKTHLL